MVSLGPSSTRQLKRKVTFTVSLLCIWAERGGLGGYGKAILRVGQQG